MTEDSAVEDLEWVQAAVQRASGGMEEHELCLFGSWLLTSLGRYDEAVEWARRSAERFAAAGGGGTGCVSWSACEAEGVAHLGAQRWRAAEESARVALSNFGEEICNYYVIELALQAQGKLLPDRFWKLNQDAAAELVAFDARAFARRRAAQARGRVMPS